MSNVTQRVAAWRILSSVALVLAAAAMALSAYLFANQREVSVQGCERQNRLRHELNLTLKSFHEPPRFGHIDCRKAYSLHFP